MDFIMNNWMVILISLIVLITYTEGQLTKAREWLLYAVTIAEERFGGGTGALKLRYVYDMFVKMFPWLSKIISFEHFSEMVDAVLVKMDNMITNNKAIREYVKTEEAKK